MSVIMALDVGSKSIGVALGQLVTRLSRPLLTIKRRSVKKDVIRLADLCREHRVTQVVVGLPYQLDGTEGRSAKLARQIGEALQSETLVPIHYHDERFSTVHAENRLRMLGKSFKKRQKSIDQVAAAVILEAWFCEQPT